MAPPKAAPRSMPALQVPHDGLARDEELVHEDVPRAHRQPPRRGQGADALLVLGPDLEVVVDHGHLPVEEEPGVRRVALEQGEELVEHLHQAQPEALVRLVPLPVPVGVGDDGDMPMCLMTCGNALSCGTHHPAPVLESSSAVSPTLSSTIVRNRSLSLRTRWCCACAYRKRSRRTIFDFGEIRH